MASQLPWVSLPLAQSRYLTLLQKICGENRSTRPHPGNDLPAVEDRGLKESDHISRTWILPLAIVLALTHSIEKPVSCRKLAEEEGFSRLPSHRAALTQWLSLPRGATQSFYLVNLNRD